MNKKSRNRRRSGTLGGWSLPPADVAAAAAATSPANVASPAAAASPASCRKCLVQFILFISVLSAFSKSRTHPERALVPVPNAPASPSSPIIVKLRSSFQGSTTCHTEDVLESAIMIQIIDNDAAGRDHCCDSRAMTHWVLWDVEMQLFDLARRRGTKDLQVDDVVVMWFDSIFLS